MRYILSSNNENHYADIRRLYIELMNNGISAPICEEII